MSAAAGALYPGPSDRVLIAGLEARADDIVKCCWNWPIPGNYWLLRAQSPSRAGMVSSRGRF